MLSLERKRQFTVTFVAFLIVLAHNPQTRKIWSYQDCLSFISDQCTSWKCFTCWWPIHQREKKQCFVIPVIPWKRWVCSRQLRQANGLGMKQFNEYYRIQKMYSIYTRLEGRLKPPKSVTQCKQFMQSQKVLNFIYVRIFTVLGFISSIGLTVHHQLL